jgi:geranylgeranyl diphosphate synthase, type I
MTLALPTTLSRTRDLVEPALRAAVGRLDETNARLARYHLGWLDADGSPGHGAGKAVRPALAVLSAEATGAAATVGVAGAVAVELVHNFSLLHDDLMDGDTERRHRPTVWALHGAPAAILAGDALLTLSTQVLLDVGTLEAVAAARLLGDTTQSLIDGQTADIAFERRERVAVDECIAMAAGKTGALLSCSAAIGAVLAGASSDVVGGLATYGAELGLAFQLVDDLLGVWGDPELTGKPVGSDLRARKKSLPVVFALAQPGAAAAALGEWYRSNGSDTAEDIARAADLVEAAGGRGWATEEARRRLIAGEAALRAAPVDDRARDELIALGRFVVTREC